MTAPGAGVYDDMDFATRDRYRHAVEDLARRGEMDEDEVTRQALALAAATNLVTMGLRASS